MSNWSWKYPFAAVTLGISALYQSSYMNFGISFCISVATLVLFSLVALSFVQALNRRFSAQQILSLFTAVIIGFGTAAFISLCSKELFLNQLYTLPSASLFRFLLPFTCTLISFAGLQALPIFQKQGEKSSSQISNPDTISIPIRKFIPDISALDDGRIVDLARLGLFENQLIVPTFLTRELKYQSENGDELSRAKAKRALESLRRLESLPRFGLQFRDIQVSETLDLAEKLILAAKTDQAVIISNESSLKPEEQGQIPALTIETIASALKPPIPKGENLAIKIQRLGKEPKQGIGYLDDGTMVVVNGGGDFLGKIVRTQVLSQKYSTSGKIVFCNVREEDEDRLHPSYSHIDVGCCNGNSSL